MFNEDAIKKLEVALVAVENCIPNYLNSKEFDDWFCKCSIRVVTKAVIAGKISLNEEEVHAYLKSAEYITTCQKAIGKHLKYIEKKTRAKYADELKVWEIIKKIPPYYPGKKTVIDI